MSPPETPHCVPGAPPFEAPRGTTRETPAPRRQRFAGTSPARGRLQRSDCVHPAPQSSLRARTGEILRDSLSTKKTTPLLLQRRMGLRLPYVEFDGDLVAKVIDAVLRYRRRQRER